MKFIFTLCLAMLAFTLTFAQHTIHGRIIDSADNRGLVGASVRILTVKDSVIQVQGTSDHGVFQLKPVAVGQYKIQVSYLGYKESVKTIRITGNNDPLEQIISLLPSYQTLDEITIQVPTGPVLKGDTTEFSAAAFSTEKFADADALVTQLPGVTLDENGNLQAGGETITKIIVDGKEMYGTDPNIVLKSLPADIIDKIQLIDDKSEQAKFTGFDDGERRKVINIVTRKDRRVGYNGRLSGGMGDTERFNTGGNVHMRNQNQAFGIFLVGNNVNRDNFSMPSIGGDTQNQGGGGGGGGRNRGINDTYTASANYSDEYFNEKIKFRMEYKFSNTNNSTQSFSNREFLMGTNANQFNTQSVTRGSINKSHQSNLRFEFDIDSNQRIDFRPNFSVQQNNANSLSNNQTMLSALDPINRSNLNNENKNRNLSFGGNLDYRLKLNQTGRTISLNINGNHNSNKGLAQSYSLNEFFENALLDRRDTISNQNNTVGRGNGVTGRLAYTEQISQNSRIQANYSLRNNSNYNNRETYEFLAETGQLGELNRQLSNEFRSDYVFQSGGISYQISKKDHFSVDIGTDYQVANMVNNRSFPEVAKYESTFDAFLPNANLTYRFNKEQNVQFNYRTSTNAPNINQLQEVVDNQNPLFVRTGNASLDQEFRNNFSFIYNLVKQSNGLTFSTNLNAELSNNKIVNSTYIASADTMILPNVLLGKGGQFSRPINVDGVYRLRMSNSVGFPIKALKINLNLSNDLFNNKDLGMLNNRMTMTNSYGVTQRINVNSKFSQNLVISARYSGSYRIVNNETNPDQSTNILSQNISNDLAYTFWKGVRIGSSIYYNTNSGIAGGESQQFTIWNASLGKKLFKRQEGEITLHAYDLLNRNTNINQNYTERFIESSRSNTLQRYFMLTFTYNIRYYPGGGSFQNRGGRPAGGNQGPRTFEGGNQRGNQGNW
jgi:hypothetical protein